MQYLVLIATISAADWTQTVDCLKKNCWWLFKAIKICADKHSSLSFVLKLSYDWKCSKSPDEKFPRNHKSSLPGDKCDTHCKTQVIGARTINPEGLLAEAKSYCSRLRLRSASLRFGQKANRERFMWLHYSKFWLLPNSLNKSCICSKNYLRFQK